jgi:hypothetical protein
MNTPWITPNTVHNDLLAAKELIYNPCDYECSFPIKEAESSEYGAYTFEVNTLSVKFRTAKITPTKIGQFVTLWKRMGKGPIQPFGFTDPIDLFIISTRKENRFGQFVFPKSVLCEQGIISTNNKEGKRAIRVYPSWDITTSKQAQKTQKWQLDFFLEIPCDKPINMALLKKLYKMP